MLVIDKIFCSNCSNSNAILLLHFGIQYQSSDIQNNESNSLFIFIQKNNSKIYILIHGKRVIEFN